MCGAVICRSLSTAVITSGYRIAQCRNGEYKEYCNEQRCRFALAREQCRVHDVLARRAKELCDARHGYCAYADLQVRGGVICSCAVVINLPLIVHRDG